MKEKEILINAVHARTFLYLHEFITEKESKKIFERIRKYQDKHKIEVTSDELKTTTTT